MALLQESITVNRCAADCYRYVSDFSTIEQWDPGVFRSEKMTAGPVAVGSRFDITLNLLGRESAMDYEITELVPNERVVLRGESSILKALDTITFTAIDEQRCRIDYQAELSFEGVPEAAEIAMMPVLKRIGRAAVDGMQQALTLPAGIPRRSLRSRLEDRLLLPGAAKFTKRGYYGMQDKSLSAFMDGKTVVVTGPTSGIGFAAACEFARLGADLILVARNGVKLATATQQIADFSGRDLSAFKSVVADLSLISDVRKAATAIRKASKQLDVLVNNAGTLFPERSVTPEGHEASVAINLLAPYTLTELLMPELIASQGHVINVVSGGLYLQGLKLSDMAFEQENYDGSKAYARAKRALLSVTEHWAEQYQDKGVRFNCMHPGWAATPGVESSLPTFNKAMQSLLRDSRMGADTIVWLASSPAATEVSGQFWFDRQARRGDLLPGTAVSSSKQQRLLEWLQASCATATSAAKPAKKAIPAA